MCSKGLMPSWEGKGRHLSASDLFLDQKNPCACVGCIGASCICRQDLCALGGRDPSLVVDVTPCQVGAGWTHQDPSSASCFRMLEVMGASSPETPVEFWVRHVCLLGCKGR